MSDQILTLFKFGLLALLYVFFARTLWAVWSEVRSPVVAGTVAPGAATPAAPAAASSAPARSDTARSTPARSDTETPPAPPVRTGAVASLDGRAGSEDATPAADLPQGVLVVVEPEAQKGMVWPLGRELTIGRAPGCGIPIDDTFVSQLHARVWAAGGSWMVEDLGSTNGTIFNEGALTEPRVMQMGDQIRVGSTVLQLHSTGPGLHSTEPGLHSTGPGLQ